MRTEQQGQRAFLSLAPIFLLSCKRTLSASALRWLLIATLCLALAGTAQSAEKPIGKKPATAAVKAHDDAWLPGDDIAAGILARAKPSEKDNTAVLTLLVGTWDYVGSFWTDPKAEPEHATGTATNEMILDQRFLSGKATGSLNVGREQIPFESRELIGFDNAKKSLSFVEVNTLTTGMTTGSGKFEEKAPAPAKSTGKSESVKTNDAATDAKDRVIRETGRFTNPLTGAEQGFRSELTFIDADHYKRVIFAAGESGKETKLVEIDYARRM